MARRIIKATTPSEALAALYQKRLDAMLRDMRDTLVGPLLADIKAIDSEINGNAPALAQDAFFPARQDIIFDAANPRHTRMIASFAERFAEWARGFEETAEATASWFAAEAAQHAGNALKHSLAAAVGHTIKRQLTPGVLREISAIVASNVELIRSIQAVYAEQVATAVMDSVTKGHDIAGLARTLEDRYGVARSRAHLIAVDQNNKATSAIDRRQRLDLGITRAVWKHMWSKTPRPDHEAADGTEYDLEKGCLINGKYVHPGEEVNCNCVSASVIHTSALGKWTPQTDVSWLEAA